MTRWRSEVHLVAPIHLIVGAAAARGLRFEFVDTHVEARRVCRTDTWLFAGEWTHPGSSASTQPGRVKNHRGFPVSVRRVADYTKWVPSPTGAGRAPPKPNAWQGR